MCALLSNNNLIVLDEVTSLLDGESDRMIQRLLNEHVRDGKAVLAIAHRIADILDFDSVVVLDEGRIIESGAPSDLLQKTNGAFRQLASLQGINC